MSKRFRVVALLASLTMPISSAQGQEPQLTPLVAEVMSAPQAVLGTDNKKHLVYELRVSNVTSANVDLKNLVVFDADRDKALATLDEAAIAARFSVGGLRGTEASKLGPAQFGVMFLHVALSADAAVPQKIIHRVTANSQKAGREMTMALGASHVSARPAVTLGRPLAGGGFVAGDGCCDSIRHVRALLPLDGRLVLAQRFAIDWEQADPAHRLVTGDTKKVENYTIFGKPVLAVADGTVVASRNDLSEQVPGALPANLPIDEADGNFVVLDIGEGTYVLYAHMQPGSVTVSRGARVKRGDVLGKVGNTGNSQAPHLHLHVMDGPSPLTSDGVAYVFESFAVTATDEAGTEDFDKAEATGSPLTLTPKSPPQRYNRALPLDLSVVDFGE